MSGTVTSRVFWATVAGATALGLALTSPAAIRSGFDVLLVVWLVVSNVR